MDVFKSFWTTLKDKGFNLIPPKGSSPAVPLSEEKILGGTSGANRMPIALGLLKDGLHLPLFNPEVPLLYQIIARINRAAYQLSGDVILIILEFSLCATGVGKSLYADNVKPYDPADFTFDSFFQ